jgi:hypothetical protein
MLTSDRLTARGNRHMLGMPLDTDLVEPLSGVGAGKPAGSQSTAPCPPARLRGFPFWAVVSGGTQVQALVGLGVASKLPLTAAHVWLSAAAWRVIDDSAMRRVAATGGLRGFKSRHRGGEASTPPSKGWRVTKTAHWADSCEGLGLGLGPSGLPGRVQR